MEDRQLGYYNDPNRQVGYYNDPNQQVGRYAQGPDGDGAVVRRRVPFNDQLAQFNPYIYPPQIQQRERTQPIVYIMLLLLFGLVVFIFIQGKQTQDMLLNIMNNQSNRSERQIDRQAERFSEVTTQLYQEHTAQMETLQKQHKELIQSTLKEQGEQFQQTLQRQAEQAQEETRKSLSHFREEQQKLLEDQRKQEEQSYIEQTRRYKNFEDQRGVFNTILNRIFGYDTNPHRRQGKKRKPIKKIEIDAIASFFTLPDVPMDQIVSKVDAISDNPTLQSLIGPYEEEMFVDLDCLLQSDCIPTFSYEKIKDYLYGMYYIIGLLQIQKNKEIEISTEPEQIEHMGKKSHKKQMKPMRSKGKTHSKGKH